MANLPEVPQPVRKYRRWAGRFLLVAIAVAAGGYLVILTNSPPRLLSGLLAAASALMLLGLALSMRARMLARRALRDSETRRRR